MADGIIKRKHVNNFKMVRMAGDSGRVRTGTGGLPLIMSLTDQSSLSLYKK